jgi:hypothetical protein
METIMQETITDKDIIKWMAGFYDAEGCFRINRYKKKGNNIYYSPKVIINNTDLDTMDYIVNILIDRYGINGYVRSNKPTTNRNIIKYLEIGRITKVIDICELLIPYSIVKYDEIKLLIDFCVSRRDRFIHNNINNGKLPYNDYEINLYSKIVEYKAHKKGRKCLSYEPIYPYIPNDISWQWLAGYTDGDGSFSINKRGSTSYCLATSNPSASEKLKDFFNSKKLSFYFDSNLPSKNHLTTCKRRIFRFFINDPSDICYIIDNTIKYLVTKYEIANVMYEYCNIRKDRKGKWRNDYEKSFINKMSLLTQ